MLDDKLLEFIELVEGLKEVARSGEEPAERHSSRQRFPNPDHRIFGIVAGGMGQRSDKADLLVAGIGVFVGIAHPQGAVDVASGDLSDNVAADPLVLAVELRRLLDGGPA
jgi:hypothetical protein